MIQSVHWTESFDAPDVTASFPVAGIRVLPEGRIDDDGCGDADGGHDPKGGEDNVCAKRS